jgi:hypothetical protein
LPQEVKAMRHILSAILVLLSVSCKDSGDINSPGNSNVAVRIDVSGDRSLIPGPFQLALDGLNWQSAAAGSDAFFFVPPGEHTLSLAQLENAPFAWCIPNQPARISTRFTRNQIVHADFGVHCPPAIGTGTLQVLVAADDPSRSIPVDLLLTRLVGISGSETLKVTPGQPYVQELTAGLYRVELKGGPCRILSSRQDGLPPLAIRTSAKVSLSFSIGCLFLNFPPGIP